MFLLHIAVDLWYVCYTAVCYVTNHGQFIPSSHLSTDIGIYVTIASFSCDSHVRVDLM